MKTAQADMASSRRSRALAEAFLRFSPRVQFREPNLIFLDIASTAHFFRREGHAPESGILESAVQLANELGFEAKAAISDSATGAQAFAHLNRHFICHPGEEREQLQPLSLPLLLHLEGVKPWENPRAIEQIVTFFFMLGFEKVGDLDRFSLISFQERWGEIGALLWKRLRGLDRVPISPLLPTEPLQEYVHLDFPVSLLSLLLHQTQRSLSFLFARLQGRCLYARQLILRLHCEYSGQHHKIEIEPNSPSRDLNLFLTLLENKLDGLDFKNPIREFEIEVIPCPERTHQLDFFEPRSTESDKLESLFSLLNQSSIRTGRYEIREAVLPEKSWSLRTDGKSSTTHAKYETEGSAAVALPLDENMQTNTRTSKARVRSRRVATAVTAPATNTEDEQDFALTPDYGSAIMQAPRPTRLLKTPRRIPIHELQRLHLLTGHPIERLEATWWDGGGRRDYYFAVSSQGQCLWVYRDLEEQEYYLHGYFD